MFNWKKFLFLLNFQLKHFHNFYRTNENESIIQLMMDRLPEERLKRNVVRGRLDVLGS